MDITRRTPVCERTLDGRAPPARPLGAACPAGSARRRSEEAQAQLAGSRRYLQRIGLFLRLIGCVLALAMFLAVPASSGAARVNSHSLLQSRQLWATIDVCNPPDQPRYVGIRGSMPGDGRAHDTMYMRFRLQYVNATSKQWTDVPNGTAPAFVAVGSGKTVRQAGRSFQIKPRAALTLRGVVNFQWRQGTRVVASTSRVTTAGRESLTGSDPAGFSAATCRIA